MKYWQLQPRSPFVLFSRTLICSRCSRLSTRPPFNFALYHLCKRACRGCHAPDHQRFEFLVCKQRGIHRRGESYGTLGANYFAGATGGLFTGTIIHMRISAPTSGFDSIPGYRATTNKVEHSHSPADNDNKPSSVTEAFSEA